jgi:cobalt-zinc-cadmium efflux system outer membrane protein
MRHYIFIFVLLLIGVPRTLRGDDAGVAVADEEGIGAITLRQALTLALLRHPDLAVFANDIRIAEARRLQASLRRNPTANLRAEDAAGIDTYKGINRTQSTLEISQVLELGGKRRARIRAAALGRDLALWDLRDETAGDRR